MQLTDVPIVIGVLGFLLSLYILFQQHLRPFGIYAAIGQRLVFEAIAFSSPGLAVNAIRYDCSCTVTLTNTGARGGVGHLVAPRLKAAEGTQIWAFAAVDFLKAEALGPKEDFLGRFTSVYLAGHETKQFHVAFQQPYSPGQPVPSFECKPDRYTGELLVSLNGRSWKSATKFGFTILDLQMLGLAASGMLSIVTDQQVSLGRLLQETRR
jgi:hypothetical protein